MYARIAKHRYRDLIATEHESNDGRCRRCQKINDRSKKNQTKL